MAVGLSPSLTELRKGGRRYQDLHDALDGISYKVLTETLRRAERRRPNFPPSRRGRIETTTLYELTELGQSLDVPLATMATWADCNGHVVERPATGGISFGGEGTSRRSLPVVSVRPRTSRYGH